MLAQDTSFEAIGNNYLDLREAGFWLYNAKLYSILHKLTLKVYSYRRQETMNMNIRAPSSMILFIAVSLVYINYKIVERFRPFYQNLRKFNMCHPVTHPNQNWKVPLVFFSVLARYCLLRAPVCITSYDKQKPYHKRVKIGYMYLLSWLLINVDKFNSIRFLKLGRKT